MGDSWKELSAGKVNAAVQRLLKALDDIDATEVVLSTINTSVHQDPKDNLATQIAQYAFIQIVEGSDYMVSEEYNQKLDRGRLARCILGDDFVSPINTEIIFAEHLLAYTEEQLDHLTETLPDVKTLFWLRENGYILIAGPPREMNLLEVLGLDDKFFPEVEPWFADDKQKFSRTHKVVPGEWLAIRKNEVPNSFSKMMDQQQDLITEDEYVPDVATLIYAVIAYYKVHGFYLLSGKGLRTGSISADFRNIIVGHLRQGSLGIYYCWPRDSCDNLGISSARKL